MPAMHEWEARVRNVEKQINDIWEFLRRLADQVGKVQQDSQMARPRPGQGARSARVAKNGGSALAARSGTTMGSGTVTLYDADESGALTSAGTATAFNLADTAVAANAWLQVKRIDGLYVIDFEECPDA
jgi:hypothetical protein